jgi:aryl-alcohol dehydrogenase-like predicted oxidoreductase
MPLRRVQVPAFGRSLSNIMACPTSAEPDAHEPGLDLYHSLGGNCIHLHGEGGETHSRVATGKWLRSRNRPDFFVCAQVCHEGWNESAQQPIDRMTPESLAEDVATDLELTGLDHLDLVYAANPPPASPERFLEAVAGEISRGRIGAFGVRNWTTEQIRFIHARLISLGTPGISAVVTTELALPAANNPLWPGDIPFAQIEPAVREPGIATFAHADAFNQGRHLFEPTDEAVHPRWIKRWNSPANLALAQRVREFASARNLSPAAVSLAWLLNRPFPVIALLGLSELMSTDRGVIEQASQFQLEPMEASMLAAI